MKHESSIQQRYPAAQLIEAARSHLRTRKVSPGQKIEFPDVLTGNPNFHLEVSGHFDRKPGLPFQVRYPQ